MTKATCPKCAGTKTFPEYAHCNNGICFRCNGTGEVKALSALTIVRTTETTSNGTDVLTRIWRINVPAWAAKLATLDEDEIHEAAHKLADRATNATCTVDAMVRRNDAGTWFLKVVEA